MATRSAWVIVWITLSAAGVSAQEGPNRPEAKPLTLDGKSTAILVLDLSARCDDPKQICSKITASLGIFLDRARAASVPIIYTVSAAAKGTPLGELAVTRLCGQYRAEVFPNDRVPFRIGPWSDRGQGASV